MNTVLFSRICEIQSAKFISQIFHKASKDKGGFQICVISIK
jgi:hypothetical protein